MSQYAADVIIPYRLVCAICTEIYYYVHEKHGVHEDDAAKIKAEELLRLDVYVPINPMAFEVTQETR